MDTVQGRGGWGIGCVVKIDPMPDEPWRGLIGAWQVLQTVNEQKYRADDMPGLLVF